MGAAVLILVLDIHCVGFRAISLVCSKDICNRPGCGYVAFASSVLV